MNKLISIYNKITQNRTVRKALATFWQTFLSTGLILFCSLTKESFTKSGILGLISATFAAAFSAVKTEILKDVNKAKELEKEKKRNL